MEEILNTNKETVSMKAKMNDILVSISWADLSRRYFSKSNSWLYHKMDGRDDNGKPTAFSPAEAEILKGALCDLADRIRKAADSI